MQSHTGHDTRNLYGNLLFNLEKAISPEARYRIDAIVREFASFKDTEKILCVLLLPTEQNGTFGPALLDDGIGSNGFEINSLGVELFGGLGGASSLHLSNQLEQSQAFTWILSHLEEDSSTCLRKDEVYEDYRIYCERHTQKALNTADFGKVMKRAFPNVRPRRLGQRGQSRYCYGGMRKKFEVQAPSLPDLTMELSVSNFRSNSSSVSSADDQRLSQRCELSPSWLTEEIRTVLGATGPILVDVVRIILQYARTILGTDFASLLHLAQHLVSDRYVTTHSRHAFALIAHLADNSTNPSAVGASSSLSNILLTPSAAAAGAFADAVHKGVHGSMHRQSLESYSHSSTNAALKPSASARSSPVLPRKDDFMKREATEQNSSSNMNMASVGSAYSSAGRVNSAGSVASSSHSQTPSLTAVIVNQIGCSGAIGGTLPYRNPPVTVASAVSLSAYQASSSPHYHFPPSHCSTSNSTLQNLATKPPISVSQTTNAYSGASAYLNQRQQPYAHSSTDQSRTNFSESPSTYQTPVTCGGNYCASASITSYPNQGLEALGSYNYGVLGDFVSQTAGSSCPIQLPQPPGPLPPPVASGRSPYAAVPYKHPTSQLPMDAPGAHEPTVRVHLGSSTPTKHMNLFSLSGGSRSTGDYETYQERASTSPCPLSTGFQPSRFCAPDLLSTSARDETTLPARSTRRPMKRPIVTCAVSPFGPDTNSNDSFDYDNLPRLVPSPRPQIPPISPTKFLNFYLGNAARSKETQDNLEDLDLTITNSPPNSNMAATSKGKPVQPLHVHTGHDEENEAELVKTREAMHDALLTPSGESTSATTSSPITPRERYGQSHSDSSAVDPPTVPILANPPTIKRLTPSSSDSNAGVL